MINVNNFKPGVTFIDDKEIFVVIEAKHSKQARGQASVKAKVKNLRSGSITVKTFTGGDKLHQAFIERKKMDYLYKDNDFHHFMNTETYDQVQIDNNKLTWEDNFLVEGSSVVMRVFEGEVLDVELSINIDLKVIKAADAVKGNTQSKPMKKVTLETGFEVEAPMFIKENEIIIISSETGKYVGRAKK